MKAAAAIVAAVVLAATGCGGDGTDAGAEMTERNAIAAEAWARTSPGGVTTGAVYMTLTADTDDTLLGASVEATVAARAELHMSMSADEDNLSSMHAVATIPLPDGVPVILEPGGYHIMLVDLAEPLVAGTSFDVVIDTATGGDEVVGVVVRDDTP